MHSSSLHGHTGLTKSFRRIRLDAALEGLE